MSDDATARARLEQAMVRPASVGEIALVLGPPIILSVVSAIGWHLRRPGPIPFNDRNVLVSLGIQVLIAACLLPYLLRRGWGPFAVAGHPEPLDFVRGVGLWLGLVAFFYLTLLVLYIAAPNFVAPLRGRPFTGALSPPAIVAAAVIDPIFEEFLLLGYAVPALGNRFGIRIASIASVTLRVAAHAYQGRLAFIAILPVALVLTFYFVRTGRLWPVIVAHVVQDALALSITFGAT
jgi:membrane protease YdiL (CAAX protease family)